ncbi:MAG TPA: ribosomal protein S18-alanine N-acetyltransferase [Anaerolineae bacterium]|nr:ribosomal protein S18-alanine N-acetyltransferase [Anaerolineae bacterium]
MTLDDLSAVMRIDGLSLPTPWSERNFRYELIDNPASQLIVAERSGDDAQILGFIGFWMLLDEAHISTIAVDPDHRRRGIGELLLRGAMQMAVPLGANMMTLEVRQSNSSAISLYAKHGFQVVGLRRQYYRDNQEDAILMTLTNLREKMTAMDGGGA